MNFISEEFKRVSFHGTEARLIQLQAEAVGISLVQKETTREGYEKEFKESVKNLISTNRISGMIFGDIYLEEHKEWVERVCGELGIEAIVVSAKQKFIEKEWIGHKVGQEFIHYLKNKKIDLCGKNGECNAFVISGPIFKRLIKIREAKVIERGNFWFLDIRKY